jgi:hypothetical protein
MAAWDKLETETNEAYGAFIEYMKMKKRSSKKVAELVGVNTQTCVLWCAHNNWVARVAAFDKAQVDEFVDARLDLIRNNQNQIITDEMNAYEKMKGAWDQHWESIKDGLTPDEMIKMVAARTQISAMARRAVGLPQNNKAPEISSQPQLPKNQPLMIPGKVVSKDSEDE